MLAQEFLELIGIEIRQNSIPSHKRRHIRLVGKPLHLLIRLSIFADIDDIEAITFPGEIFLRVNAP